MKSLILSVSCCLFLLPGKGIAFQTDRELVYNDVMLIQVIKDVQVKTSYYFLYRESQVSNIKVSLITNENEVLSDLSTYLNGFGLIMQVDSVRRQVLLVKSNSINQQSRSIFISGQVVDANSGERLPYATIAWVENQKLNGTVTNGSGVFSVQRKFKEQFITLNVSYIGYQHKSIKIDLTENTSIKDLTVRLTPTTLLGRDIIITDYMGYNPMDTLLTGMIDAGRFSPLGESNSIRALQSHPSVTNGPALNRGIHVRGSSPDGFTVLLDGMSIFNQTHLFGLLDSFNDDAIQSAGYFFDITPAHIESATGGTLNLITRTGSRNQFKKQIGISNSSIKATLEGPIGSRTSWLLSGRTSYIDQIVWFDNPRLIQWGLDVDRPKKITTNDPDFTDLVLKPGKSHASFVDLHGKIYFETINSDRFTLSAYYGGDVASHIAERRTRSASTQGEFVFLPVKTSNEWGNTLVSLAYDKQLFPRIFSKSIAGISTYRTDFSKEDFVYSRVSEMNGNESVTIFTYPFRNRSSITEFKFNQEFNYTSQVWSLISGATLKHYTGAYSEFSFDRPSYYTQSSSYLADLYMQADYNPINWAQIQAGMRVYKYSLNKTINVAPRFKIRFEIIPDLHLIGGYSINQQFLHKISIENATTTDVWVLTTKDQPSAKSTQISTGLELSPSRNMYVKVEIYDKKFENIRVHELNQQSFENTFSDIPWMYSNSGHAKGVEVLVRNIWNRLTLTQSYTLSRMIYQNPFLFDGESFFADWDRTHSYNPVLEIDVNQNVKINLSWLMMTGIPNSIEITQDESQTRLDDYQRLDISGIWDKNLSNSVNLQIKFSVYNVLNRDNVWYRNFAFNFDETRSIPLLRPVSVDVLDLGLQPSFSVKISF